MRNKTQEKSCKLLIFSHNANRMSFFSVKLNALMVRKNLSAADLGRLTNIDDAKISRWLNDKQRHVDPADLERLAASLGQNKADQAQLLVSHLQDMCVGPGADLVQIQIGEAPAYITERHEIPLPPRLETAFAVLRANIEDPDLQQILVSLANLFNKPSPQSSKYPHGTE